LLGPRWQKFIIETDPVQSLLSKVGKSPQVRVGVDIVQDTSEGRFDFRDFAVLLAVYAIIGDKSYASVHRDRVRAGAMGYGSAKDLFDAYGKVTRTGEMLLSRRQDGTQPLTLDQCRYTLDKLHESKNRARWQDVHRLAQYG